MKYFIDWDDATDSFVLNGEHAYFLYSHLKQIAEDNGIVFLHEHSESYMLAVLQSCDIEIQLSDKIDW